MANRKYNIETATAIPSSLFQKMTDGVQTLKSSLQADIMIKPRRAYLMEL